MIEVNISPITLIVCFMTFCTFIWKNFHPEPDALNSATSNSSNMNRREANTRNTSLVQNVSNNSKIAMRKPQNTEMTRNISNFYENANISQKREKDSSQMDME